MLVGESSEIGQGCCVVEDVEIERVTNVKGENGWNFPDQWVAGYICR